MALSDFMPYGAPELIDHAEARLARSTTVASLMVAALVVVSGVIATRGFTSLSSTEQELRVFVFDPPSLWEQPVQQVRTRITQTAIADPHANLRAVPDVPDEPVAPVPLDLELLMTDPGKGGTTTPVGALDGDKPLVASTDDPPGDGVQYAEEFPNVVRCREPRYPDLAREAGVEGTVRVLVLVGLDGRVRRAMIAAGGSVPMLDETALEAARSCVFTPALADHRPVKVWISRQYRFRLH